MNLSIPLPNKVSFQEDGNKATLEVSPLFPGFGTTIGNALRRVLLSSIPGAAVTAFKMKGVEHEFSAIDGVSEDAIEIILNLKQLRLKIFQEGNDEIRLKLNKKGKGVVTAGDIEKFAGVEVMNKDLVICTITSATAVVDMEIFVNKGRGFTPNEMKASERTEIGVIDIDSVYTPLLAVGYRVENVRVGQMTNFDKLILQIETDGTITSREAVGLASDVLLEHLNLLTESHLLQRLREQGVPQETPAVPTNAESDQVEAMESALTSTSEVTLEAEPEKKKRGRPKKAE